MNIDGKVVRFNFLPKIISAQQAQLQKVFSYFQLPEHVHDFCTIQMNKELQTFNSLCWKKFLELECHVPCIANLQLHSWDQWRSSAWLHRSKNIFLLALTPHSSAVCPLQCFKVEWLSLSLSPWQVPEESSTVLSWFTYEWPLTDYTLKTQISRFVIPLGLILGKQVLYLLSTGKHQIGITPESINKILHSMRMITPSIFNFSL